MTDFEMGRLLYLALLLVAIGSYFVVAGRERLSKTARDAAMWGLIFLAGVAVYGLWNDISNQFMPRQSLVSSTGQIVVPQAPDGHYYLTMAVDGTPVRFVVDTGATDLVLSLQDARRVGIDPATLHYFGQAQTANGTVNMANVRLKTVTLEGITLSDVRASVNGGKMDGSLLGMTFLNRFKSMQFEQGRLILTP